MKFFLIFSLSILLTLGAWASGSSGAKNNTKQKNSAEEKKLLKAIEKNTLGDIDELITADINLEISDDLGKTALHVAAETGKTQTLRLLLLRGASIDSRDNEGKTPLHYGVEGGEVEIVQTLLSAGADLLSADNQGETALSLSLQKESDLFLLLIENAEADRLVLDSLPLLHALVNRGLNEHVRRLLESDSSLRLKKNEGLTALDLLLTGPMNSSDFALAKILIQADSPPPLQEKWRYLTALFLTEDWEKRFEYGSTPLHLACEYGQEGMLRYLLEKGVNLEAKDDSGSSALHIAAGWGYRHFVVLLLDAGADINTVDYYNNSPLHEALSLWDGRVANSSLADPNKEENPETSTVSAPTEELPLSSGVELVRVLLDKGADPNAKNKGGSTPLHLSVFFQQEESAAQMLMEKGAFLEARDNEGNTPLLLAARENKRSQALLFLDKGASIFAYNNQKTTPVEIILKKGLDSISWFFNEERITRKDNEGRTILHYAIKTPLTKEVFESLMQDSKILINAQDRRGNTPLHEAVQEKKLPQIKSLLDNDADLYLENNQGATALSLAFDVDPQYSMDVLENRINQEDRQGNTPLFHAIQWKRLSVAQRLLQEGADLNHRNKQGDTVLHEAVRVDSEEALRLFLGAGMDPNARNKDGKTALHKAIIWAQNLIPTLLEAENIDINSQDKEGKTPLHLAALAEETKSLVRLLDAGASPEIQDKEGKTGLFLATEVNNGEHVRLLIPYTSSLQRRDAQGQTVLHKAIEKKYSALAQYFLSRGADLFAVDKKNLSVFDLLLRLKFSELELYLKSSQINQQDHQGNSFLHLAISSKATTDYIAVLLDSGIDKELKNVQGMTAKDLAESLGEEETVSLLR